ncbi:MAG: right-handed parallel beta-helix repeat-containing protein [Dehalococcoidia bacterium]|nr:right-handed parallel beta-helix repeat-containing protein [Dehalococcoidia bacterium]
MTRTRLYLLVSLAALAVATLTFGAARARTAAGQAACTTTVGPSTLQPAINAAGAGSVICMAPGVYIGPITFQSKNGVTLRGAGRQATIIAGGARDGMLIFNSQNLTFENFLIYFGHPSDAYVFNSQNITFQQIDAGGGGIGIHFDAGSIGRISDSMIYAMEGDGVLVRRGSNVTVERNWVFVNGGVGVSTVGDTATTTITRNIISDNRGPGVFAGQTPCALLPPGFVEVPACYLMNLQSFVGDANIILDANIIQASGSTGIVMFPGTRATMRNNRIWRNELTGLFAWGANVTSDGDEFSGNEEHAIEFRAYPDPLKYGQVGPIFPVRAVGRINNANIHDSVVLAETGRLGGGVLAQGANLDVTNSRIYNNRGIGVSYVNTSLGTVSGNVIDENRGSAICVFNAGNVATAGNTIFGNVDDRPGICRETTP